MGLFSSASKRSLKHYSGLIGVLIVLGLPQAVQAQTVLTWARVEFLRNRVQLIPNGAGVRSAQIADILGIGDALRTARASRAELRFNDGSLARIGERATFRFTPNTRNFQLSNGTVLLLIPPGRGRTTIQTPNAVTGIQGSALFVRFIEETDTTIIGALTYNPAGPIVAYNEDGSQEQL
ncbi:MAG: FecR family protein, partial [Cyanobacteria bacterium J06626_23]